MEILLLVNLKIGNLKISFIVEIKLPELIILGWFSNWLDSFDYLQLFHLFFRFRLLRCLHLRRNLLFKFLRFRLKLLNFLMRLFKLFLFLILRMLSIESTIPPPLLLFLKGLNNGRRWERCGHHVFFKFLVDLAIVGLDFGNLGILLRNILCRFLFKKPLTGTNLLTVELLKN